MHRPGPWSVTLRTAAFSERKGGSLGLARTNMKEQTISPKAASGKAICAGQDAEQSTGLGSTAARLGGTPLIDD